MAGIRVAPRGFSTKYRAELMIAAAALLGSAIVNVVVVILFEYRNPMLAMRYGLALAAVLLMLLLLFNQRRLIESKFALVNRVLTDHFGYAYQDNQYFRRRIHYAQEKLRLAKVVVNQALPRILADALAEHPGMQRVNIIIDSGTTLAPLFPELLAVGVRSSNPKLDVRLFTNSMSGIGEIHRLGGRASDVLSEEDFNLIGGQPLSKYRATTGKVTMDFLKSLWSEANDSTGSIVTIGIVTANWLLGGKKLDSVSLCARGRGHLKFKKAVCEHSDYRLVVAPLGKILPLTDVGILNEMLPRDNADPYNTYELPPASARTTHLLTTHRRREGLSPFSPLSEHLRRIDAGDEAVNYLLCEEAPVFDPPGDSLREVFAVETPHGYIEENFSRAYGNFGVHWTERG